MAKIYKKNDFDRFVIPLYLRSSFWLMISLVISLAISLLISLLNINNIILISLLISFVISTLILLTYKIIKFMKLFRYHKGYHYQSVKIENQIKKSLIDIMLLNSMKQTKKIQVPDVLVDLSETKNNGNATVKLERLAGMNNIEDLAILVSNSFKHKYSSYAVTDFKEAQDKLSYTFILSDVNKSYRLTPKSVKELITDDIYTLTVMKNLTWDMNKQPHLILSALTGGGKSFFLMGLMLQMLYNHNEEDTKNGTGLYIFDAKQEFSSFTFFKDRIYSDTSLYLEKMKNFIEVLKEREKAVAKGIEKAGKMGYTAKDLGLRPIVIVFEELSATVAGFDNKERKEWDSYLSQLAMKSRVAGIFLVAISQNFNATDTLKVAIRNQFNFRILLGNNFSREDVGYIFGSNNETVTPLPEKFTGFYSLAGITNTPQRIEPTDISNINTLEHFKQAYLHNNNKGEGTYDKEE